jgi:hypothetical protein
VSGPGVIDGEAPWPTAPPGQPGLKIGFSEAPATTHAPRPRHRRMLLPLLVVLAVVALVFVLVAVVAPPSPPAPCAPLACQGPPVGRGNGVESAISAPPVRNGVPYDNHQGFSLRYQTSGGEPSVKTDSDGITLTWDLVNGSQTTLQVIGQPAGGTSAQGLVQTIATQIAPGAAPVYVLPGAMVGYVPGYGEGLNVQNASSDGSTSTVRVIVMAAVQNGLGVAVVAVGPLLPPVTPSSKFWDGHPSPANVAAAYLADPVINRITFPASTGP